jgi:hypothetical protein
MMPVAIDLLHPKCRRKPQLITYSSISVVKRMEIDAMLRKPESRT